MVRYAQKSRTAGSPGASVTAPLARATVLPRGLLILLGLAAATVSVAGIRAISGILAPTFLGLVLAIAVHPVRRLLRHRHAPSWLSTLTAIALAYAIVLTLVFSLLLAVARLVTLVPTYEDELSSLVDDVSSWLASLGVGQAQSSTLMSSLDLGRLADLLSSVLGGLLEVLSNLFFLGTLLLFVTADAAWFPQRLSEARPVRGELVEAFESFAHGTRAYLVVSTVFGLIVAVIDTGLLWALGLPAPALWGLLAFMTNYVPNIGFVIGLIPPAILALLEGGPGLCLAVIASYSLINVVIQTVIQPKIVGDVVGLSTTMTFLSLAFWTWVLGPLGALLAIPATLFTKALLVDVDTRSVWVRPLISGEAEAAPAPDPEATGTPS
jgi:AI-2 transport protein TqsA